MTTIGSTAYYNSTSYYGGHEKTDANATIGSTEDYTSGLRYNGTEKATAKGRETHASSAVWQDKSSQRRSLPQ